MGIADDRRSGDEERDTDRELGELTSELRVIIPGVTVLFAFLLTVPFAAGFGRLDPVDRGAYFVAFLSTAAAIVLLIGESAYHRLRGKPYDKRRLLRTSSRQAVAAIGLLAVALSAVVFLVTGVLFGRAVAVPVAAGLLVLATATWFVLPISRRD